MALTHAPSDTMLSPSAAWRSSARGRLPRRPSRVDQYCRSRASRSQTGRVRIASHAGRVLGSAGQHEIVRWVIEHEPQRSVGGTAVIHLWVAAPTRYREQESHDQHEGSGDPDDGTRSPGPDGSFRL